MVDFVWNTPCKFDENNPTDKNLLEFETGCWGINGDELGKGKIKVKFINNHFEIPM